MALHIFRLHIFGVNQTRIENTKKKSSRRKEIIKIKSEINEKEMKEMIAKINKTKSWF